jgi:hypothetical protein
MRWRRRRRRSTPRVGQTTNSSIPRRTTARGATGNAGTVAPRPLPPSPPLKCGQATWCPLTWSRHIPVQTLDQTSLRASNCGACPTTSLTLWTPQLSSLSSSSTTLSYRTIRYSIHEAKYSKYDYFAHICRKSIVQKKLYTVKIDSLHTHVRTQYKPKILHT